MIRFTPAAVDAISRQIERFPRGGPMALALLVGIGAGCGAVVFEEMIIFSDWFFFDLVKDQWLGALGDWRLMLIPVLGGLIVGPLTYRFAPEARGDGVPEVMLALETRGGRMRRRVPFFKSLASAVTIGSGGSVGKEGPIMQIGSSIGSALGQALRLGEEHVRLLVAAGTAGGVAATFHAPIAGVFFALEVVLRRFSTRNFTVVVLSAVVATAISDAVFGNEPGILIPRYQLVSPVEIPLYAVLGMLAGTLAVVLIRILYWTEYRFGALRFPPFIVMPALGGLLLGPIGLIDIRALGLGEDTMNAVLVEHASTALGLLLVLKLAATAITVGSGGSGGVFRPSLFLGALLGVVFGSGVHMLLPDLTATSGAYGTVGTAAVFAGAARAPLTSILILLELTRDYGIMLPLMTAVATSTVVSQLLSPGGSIYTLKLHRMGLHLEYEEPPSTLGRMLVSDAMSPALTTFAPDASLGEVASAFEHEHEPFGMVLDEDDRIVGVIAEYHLDEALDRDQEGLTAADVCTPEFRRIRPDRTLREALNVFAGWDQTALPVVEADAPFTPIGLLRRDDIAHALAQAVTRRERLEPVTGDDPRYLELRVSRAGGLDGVTLSDLELPEDAVVVAVRHRGATLIPRGGTTLREGDRVTVIVAATSTAEVRALFAGRG